VQEDTSLETLMARYQEGNSKAATALVHRASPQLHRYFLSQMASRRHADDLLQETWLRVHQARHTYRAGEPLMPWLYAIARYTRVDHYRRASRAEFREQQVEELPEVTASNPDQGGGIPDLEMLLATLPESQREVVAMLKLSGMSIEEVARATSSTVGSVKQKAHRAYEKLRGRMVEMGFSRAAGDAG
jgi:RNA polymerase sigma-70 factor (ECF subfamily)